MDTRAFQASTGRFTLTTVGYGDITPHTVLGKFIASVIMIMGYGIIAVPTGIFSMELRQAAKARDARVCANCETVESAASPVFADAAANRSPRSPGP